LGDEVIGAGLKSSVLGKSIAPELAAMLARRLT
jgi:hypothetical protein